MNKYWKEQEVEKVRCANCNKYVTLKKIETPNTIREYCPLCEFTNSITLKKKKLTKRDW